MTLSIMKRRLTISSRTFWFINNKKKKIIKENRNLMKKIPKTVKKEKKNKREKVHSAWERSIKTYSNYTHNLTTSMM